MKKTRLFAKTSLFSKNRAKADRSAVPDEPPETATRRIILEIAGDFSSDPSSLNDSLSLRDNLQYKDNEFTLLQIRLNEYVGSKKKEASVSVGEADGCEKVGDCVSLVEGKLS